MRKAVTVIISVIFSLLLMLAVVPTAGAALHGETEETTVEVMMEIGETTYTINGHEDEMDVWPFILDGRTMVPVRFVAEAFGLEADWGPKDARTQWVSIENEAIRIELEIGSPLIHLDFRDVVDPPPSTVTSDVEAQIIDGRTYLPLRVIGEIFGAEFDWGPKDALTEWVSFTLRDTDPVDIDPIEPENDQAAIDEVHVRMAGFSFNPQTITVSRGTTVVWTNEDVETHTVTSTGNFDSGEVAPGATFSYVFDQNGTFNYFCIPHPFMVGTVIVE